ncbi:MAG: ribosome small subunit-dependent GTPase A [Gammaproteobacteria bacterium]
MDFDFALLQRIGFTQHTLAQLSQLHDGEQLGRITAVQRDRVTLHDGRTESSLRIHSSHAPAVGDWAVGAGAMLARLLDPATSIVRRTADGQRQRIAGNVDTALLVMGLDHDFNPRRIERYIALARASAVMPVVVLTKADAVADASARRALLRARLPASVDIVSVNGLDAQAAATLAPWLGAGQTLVLLGSSGAGKSSLTNTLCAAGQDTGAVRGHDSRGRHTTTARSLHLCASGACIIDTPGLRALAADADADGVAATFDDIDALARECRFHDCRHASEPGCAVRGAVDPDRLHNFNKLLREAERASQTPLDRIAERARWKVVVKAAQARRRG